MKKDTIKKRKVCQSLISGKKVKQYCDKCARLAATVRRQKYIGLKKEEELTAFLKEQTAACRVVAGRGLVPVGVEGVKYSINPQELFDSFHLEGKITEQHAKDILEILKKRLT